MIGVMAAVEEGAVEGGSNSAANRAKTKKNVKEVVDVVAVVRENFEVIVELEMGSPAVMVVAVAKK